MRYVVERDLRNTDLLVTSVRNNWRLKAGQLFLGDDFEEIYGNHFTKVGEVLRITQRGKLRKLYRHLDVVAPNIAGQIEQIDEVVDSLSQAVANAIIAEAKRLRSEGVDFPALALTLRQKIIEKLDDSHVY